MTKDTRSEIMEKVGSQGDLTNLSDPEVRKLFDPDEKLSDEEVRERADRFQQERNKQSMDTPLTVSARMGMDGGDMRTIGPGEGLDDKGQIILLDPAKAEAAAERFTNADPRTAKQSMRRSAALQDLVNHLFIREEPGPSVVHLPLEKCRQLHEEYQQAKAEEEADPPPDAPRVRGLSDGVEPWQPPRRSHRLRLG